MDPKDWELAVKVHVPVMLPESGGLLALEPPQATARSSASIAPEAVNIFMMKRCSKSQNHEMWNLRRVLAQTLAPETGNAYTTFMATVFPNWAFCAVR